MPQLYQLPDVALSQLLWLLIGLGFIYFVIARGMVPKIQSTVENRDRKISDDLESAQRARDEAESTEAEYRERIEASRGEAIKLSQQARQAGAMEAEERSRAIDAEIGKKIAKAEESIRTSVAKAITEIDQVAADAAHDLVVKLTGRDVSAGDALKAVRAAVDG